jgi:hypothetical protein
VNAAIEWISDRAGDVVGDALQAETVAGLCRELMDEWDSRRKGLETGGLSYTSDRDNREPLLDSGVGSWGTWSAGWSLREVEPETNLLISLSAPEVAKRPDWKFGGGQPEAPTADVDETDELEAADEVGLLSSDPLPAAIGEPAR